MTEQPLSAPEPVTAVPTAKAAGLVPVSQTRLAELSGDAERIAAELGAMDPMAPDFSVRVGQVLALGEAEMRAAATIAGRLLDRAAPGVDLPADQVGLSLTELRQRISEVDPAGRKVFGFSLGNPAKKLLARYQAASAPINAVVRTLRARQDDLRRDNAAIQGERERLWAAMGQLSEAAAMAGAVDEAIDRQASILDLADPARANAVRAEVLFPVRQRHQDLLTQLAVSVQGYLALDVLRRNNDELVRGVERAASTTVSALRVAVVVSGALAGQRKVIDELETLRATTDGLVKANADLIAMQGRQIHQISTDPAVGIEALRQSFDQIYRAIDDIEGFKAAAATAMATTVSALEDELRRAQDRLRETE
ncbi:toxic anion resistance protein [Kutzneria sp. CA-103260]|uniref:toxic anion resistance protein n=1 Tax=Kutzneria sp. CA-103260 TaxID=2802641 RepID=UPI001BA493F4|nr:toxic anion resistance protein [Kutzneria sp. CA-103260]QUQ65241.1 toxic anion resistance family protein [Kutzneria sp. CA-103260]